MLTVERHDVTELCPRCGREPRVYMALSTRLDPQFWAHEVLLACPCRAVWAVPAGLSGDGVLRVT